MSIFQNEKDRLTRKYGNIPDLGLVNIIATPPYDSEAVAYLIYVRYYNLLRKTFFYLFKSADNGDGQEAEFKDALSELFLKLCDNNNDKFRLYDPKKSKFSTWFCIVAHNTFFDFTTAKIYEWGKVEDEETDEETDEVIIKEIYEETDKKAKKNKKNKYIPRKVYLDDDKSDYTIEQASMLSNEKDIEKGELKSKLLIYINKLQDLDRFIILKQLEGYHYYEIANLLEQWSKDNNGKESVYTVGYVSVLLRGAKNKLKEMSNNQINK